MACGPPTRSFISEGSGVQRVGALSFFAVASGARGFAVERARHAQPYFGGDGPLGAGGGDREPLVELVAAAHGDDAMFLGFQDAGGPGRHGGNLLRCGGETCTNKGVLASAGKCTARTG